MRTVETVDGITVNIDWEFEGIIERHDSNWCEWYIVGTGDNGVDYEALCQADRNNPEDFHADVTEVEPRYD